MKNILIIYADQLRRDVLGCYGGKEVETPYIDSIAKEGIVLDQCFTPSAVCTPSRGCFMTGHYPYHNGAVRNGVPVREDEHGFAEAFAKAGYVTGYTGKWHLADHKEMGAPLGNYNPLGFENWNYKLEIGHCKSILSSDNTITPGDAVGDTQSYTTDWLMNETIRCLEKRDKKKPFLHMVSIPDPHQPYHVRKPYDTMFDPLSVEIPKSFYEDQIPDWAELDEWGRHHYLPRGMFEREGHLRRMKALYLGMVKCIDDNVGKMIRYLKEEDLWKDTMVVFTTDHGEYMGEHGLMEKNNLYESVYHLPLVISMPGETCCGTRNQSYVSVVDFGVTLAGLAGISYPYTVHGYDRSACLKGGMEEGAREVYIHPSDVPRTGIITQNYELAYVGGGLEGIEFKDHILFDRIHDPLQLVNLYGNQEYAEVVKELTDKIIKHHQTYHTPQSALPKEVRW